MPKLRGPRSPYERGYSDWMSLHDIVRRACPHETTPVPFDRRLVMCHRLSLAVSSLSIFIYSALSLVTEPIGRWAIFVLLGQQLDGLLHLVQTWAVLLIGLNLGYVVVSLLLMIFTANLRQGRSCLQWLAFGQVLLGGLNSLVFSLTIFIFVLNFVFWLVVLALVAFLIMAVASGVVFLLRNI